MALRDLMIVADNSVESVATFDYAAAIARDQGAHLVVLYPIPTLPPAMYMGIEYSTDWLAAVADNIREDAAECRDRLQDRARELDIDIEWRSEEGEPSRVAAQFSRYVDLTVMTQSGGDHDSEGLRALSEYFILESGRPVIQVPYIGAEPAAPRHVVVAWDGSRAATRALHDAMPLLSRTENVELVSIHRGRHDADSQEIAAIDISAHLARHDVNVETRVMVAEDIDAADLLLSHVSDSGADMVVMGAYGHSRLRELILGGMTRGILRAMTVPVLMSH